MTMHEVLVSTAWVVLVGYALYLAWFVRTEVRLAFDRRKAAARRLHPSSHVAARLSDPVDS